MVATGRVPNTKTLGLDSMGIETVRGFVQVCGCALVGIRRITLCETASCPTKMPGVSFTA